MNYSAEGGFAGASPDWAVRLLRNLRNRPINYRPAEVNRQTWHFDTYRKRLPPEYPGPPEMNGSWEAAAALIRDYEFSVPNVVRAFYDASDPLVHRDMLLEGRFLLLRLRLGVRITAVIDETRPQAQRVWGWSYETLHGHLERGKLSYEVVKYQESGAVEFIINAYSQPAPTLGPVLRAGWAMFGRQRQLQFYRDCGERMDHLVRAGRGRQRPPRTGGFVLAPSDARSHWFDRFAIHRTDPGHSR